MYFAFQENKVYVSKIKDLFHKITSESRLTDMTSLFSGKVVLNVPLCPVSLGIYEAVSENNLKYIHLLTPFRIYLAI